MAFDSKRGAQVVTPPANVLLDEKPQAEPTAETEPVRRSCESYSRAELDKMPAYLREGIEGARIANAIYRHAAEFERAWGFPLYDGLVQKLPTQELTWVELEALSMQSGKSVDELKARQAWYRRNKDHHEFLGKE